MTAVSDRVPVDTLPDPAAPAAAYRFRRRDLAPVVFVVANAIAFLIVRPGVNDLWAARARASAAAHGVGLTYWFSWFGGGSTPGNYSVLTPYVSAVVGAEVLGAISALAIVVAAWPLLRGSLHSTSALAVVTIGATANMWSGRIPFLFGCVFAVLSFTAVRRQRPWLAGLLSVISVFCSPVSGAFIALGLAGAFISEPTKRYRRICLSTVGTVLTAMVFVAVAFGNPGPEGFSVWLALELALGMAVCLWAAPAPWVRTTIGLSLVVLLVLFAIPNGLGANLMRWGWFFLPVAVIATSTRRLVVGIALIASMVGAGVEATIADLVHSTDPTATTAFYKPLAAELDKLPELTTYRLEVISHGFSKGSHAGDDALLNHAMLARGWETQEDVALNSILGTSSLTPVSFKVWLDNNAVGYVAIPREKVQASPEYNVVANGTSYLRQVWQSVDWRLFMVVSATPIIERPATVQVRSQARLQVEIPCRCSTFVRLRYSKFLKATMPGSDGLSAKVSNDGSGWTLITTTVPGKYDLEGKLSGLFN